MKKRTRRPRTFRPLLEQFEARCLMSVTAVADSAHTHFGAPTIDVLSNDLGSSLSIVSYTQGVYGVVTQVGTELKYTTDSGVSATTDSFWYTMHDNTGASASASVTILFDNQLPTAQPFTATPVHPGESVSTKAIADTTDPGLDTDPDGDTVVVQSLGSASYGTVSINGDGTIKYTANAGTSATVDSFS